MSFFKQDRSDKGKVYIMKMKFREEEDYVYKIGVTINNPVDRLMTILRSYCMIYRYVPDSSVKRFKTTERIYKKEAMLHRYFKEQQYVPEKKFDGSTELFRVEEELLLQVYKDCIEGVDINSEEYQVELLEDESEEDRKE